MPTATMKKLTPVLVVDAIEPCLPFWEKVGFSKTVEVPHGDVLGFVILVKDEVEVMYQTLASVTDDVPALASEKIRAALYIEVSDLDSVIAALKGAPEYFARRKAPYGAEEIGFREPGGNFVTFAQQG